MTYFPSMYVIPSILMHTLSLPFPGQEVREALVTEYKTGIVHRIQSWQQPDGAALDAVYQTYAHRSLPSLLLQDIKVRLWLLMGL